MADAFRSGDRATLASLIDMHVIWHVPGRIRWPETSVVAAYIEAWLDRLRTKGFWLVEDDVFGRRSSVRPERHGRAARASMRKHESGAIATATGLALALSR